MKSKKVLKLYTFQLYTFNFNIKIMKKILLILTIIAAPWYLSAQSTTITSGASVTIGVGASITTGDITNTLNTGLIIESDDNGSGSLIGGSEPNATVQRFVEQNGWHLVTPITIPTTAYDFWTGAVEETWLASHDETSNTYTYITEDDALTRAQGYSYWIENGVGDQTIEFTGTIIGTDVSASLTKGGDGWNLIGNPFTSALEWGSSWSSGTSGTAYVWDNDDVQGTNNGYKFYNGTSGTLTDGIIPLGQGFFVEASSTASFTIPASARVHNHTNAFYKSTNATGSEPNQYIRIELDGGYYGNTVFVGFPENGSDDFDISGDATKLYSSTENVQFFAVENDDELCINANAPLFDGESKTVPLNLVQVTDGEHTMAFSNLNQLTDVSITLEDVLTTYTQDIRENHVYTFNTSTNDNAERFLLHFAWSPNGINEDIEEGSSNIQIYSFGNEVYIRSTDDAINQGGNVTIYDMMGRELAQQKIAAMELVKMPVNTTNSFVVVKVVKAGSAKIQKVYIK